MPYIDILHSCLQQLDLASPFCDINILVHSVQENKLLISSTGNSDTKESILVIKSTTKYRILDSKAKINESNLVHTRVPFV